MLQVSGFCYMLPMVRKEGREGRERRRAPVCLVAASRPPLPATEATVRPLPKARLRIPTCWARSASGARRSCATPLAPPPLLVTALPSPLAAPAQGLSCATAVRVSNALGAGLPHAARRSAHTATAITAVTQASLAAALVLGRNVWGAVFTDLPEVRRGCGG